jgi:hypothetical protein
MKRLIIATLSTLTISGIVSPVWAGEIQESSRSKHSGWRNSPCYHQTLVKP